MLTEPILALLWANRLTDLDFTDDMSLLASILACARVLEIVVLLLKYYIARSI